jgi:hypothetical protein
MILRLPALLSLRASRPKLRVRGQIRRELSAHLLIGMKKPHTHIGVSWSQSSMSLWKLMKGYGGVSVVDPMIALVVFEEIINARNIATGSRACVVVFLDF